MVVKLLTEHHLEFLSLKGGCRGSSESTLVKMSNCWKSHATAQLFDIDVPIFQREYMYYMFSSSEMLKYCDRQVLVVYSLYIPQLDSSYTVKPVLNGHSKIDKTKILMTNDSLKTYIKR